MRTRLRVLERTLAWDAAEKALQRVCRHYLYEWDRAVEKGANLEALRPDEQRKIKCGKSHFEGALGVSYRVISGASDLP